MAKPQDDRASSIRNAATGVGTMVLAVISFLAMLWIVMAIIRALFGLG